MFESRFSSSAHPFGPVALDSPAGGETDGLTEAEKQALVQVGSTVMDSVRAQYGQKAPPPEDKPARSSWMLVGAVAAAVAVLWFVRRR